MSARKEIRRFIEDSLKKMRKEVTFSDSDNIFEQKIVNSLFSMRLINFLEKTYHITIEESDLIEKNFSSIDNIISFLTRKNISTQP